MNWFPKPELATVFEIKIATASLTVIIASKKEVQCLRLFEDLKAQKCKPVGHIACASDETKIDYPVIGPVVIYSCPVYQKGDDRDASVCRFWSGCNKAIETGHSVLIHCNNGFYRSPILLAAVMVMAGYDRDAALDLIGKQRWIYAGLTTSWQKWPPGHRKGKHSQALLESCVWLANLNPETLTKKFLPNVVRSRKELVATTTYTIDNTDGWKTWYCEGCKRQSQNLRECWQCFRWECRGCGFWCTLCPPGEWKYFVCKQCQEQEGYLTVRGQKWLCQPCIYREYW